MAIKSVVLETTGARTWALIFDKGDDPVTGLTAFAKGEKLAGAHFTAIGAFSQVRLGYFQRDKKAYKEIPVNDQVEVLSLVGDIALENAEPTLRESVHERHAAARGSPRS